jgi:hypothetical protein
LAYLRRHGLYIRLGSLTPDYGMIFRDFSSTIPIFETPEEVRDRVVEAFDYMRVDTTDGFGFSLLCDNDTSMTRDTAFAKIRRTNS